MRRILGVIAVAGALLSGGCGELGSDADDVQQQQLQRGFYAPGQPTPTSLPSDSATPKREPVPGEVTDR